MDRARRLHAARLRRASRRRDARRALLPRHLLPDEPGRVPGRHAGRDPTGREDIDGFRGLAWRGGALPAVAMAIFLFSLAGLPPLAGFIGKFYLFAAVIQGGLYVLVVIAVLNSVVSLYYYARVVKMMILDLPAPDDPRVAFRPVDLGVVGALSLATTFLVVQFGWLLRTVTEAGRVFRG